MFIFYNKKDNNYNFTKQIEISCGDVQFTVSSDKNIRLFFECNLDDNVVLRYEV